MFWLQVRVRLAFASAAGVRCFIGLRSSGASARFTTDARSVAGGGSIMRLMVVCFMSK